MSDAEKLSMVRTLLAIHDNSEDDRLAVYLAASAREILAWKYSYATEQPETVPPELEMTQIFAVISGYSMSGAEGQLAHSENGISRTFKFDDMIAYIHTNVTPIVKVM